MRATYIHQRVSQLERRCAELEAERDTLHAELAVANERIATLSSYHDPKQEVARAQAHTTALREALKDLLEQVDSLDDIKFTRDVDSYKAKASWNDAYERACKALRQGEGEK